MGVFVLRAEPTRRDCELPEVPDGGFTFEAHLARNDLDGGVVVFVNADRAAGSSPAAWDGRRFQWTAEARRGFPSRCGDCPIVAQEDVELTLLSRAQNEALGNTCPSPSPDGGGELTFGEADPPRWTPLGFDAVRACGTLILHLEGAQALDGGRCPEECSPCLVEYRLRGERT